MVREEEIVDTFRIGFWYTEGGFVNVEATSQEEAQTKLDELLSDYGLDALTGGSEYDCPPTNEHGLSVYEVTHREWQGV